MFVPPFFCLEFCSLLCALRAFAVNPVSGEPAQLVGNESGIILPSMILPLRLVAIHDFASESSISDPFCVRAWFHPRLPVLVRPRGLVAPKSDEGGSTLQRLPSLLKTSACFLAGAGWFDQAQTMGKSYESIPDDLRAWIAEQPMFFVATGPLSAAGRINCSPKGGDTFRIIGPNEVAYQDYVGSGAETVAHLRENQRIIIMFCAFHGPPNIVRLHGHGEVFALNHPRYAELAARFSPHPAARAIICVRIDRVSESCGFGVPLMAFQAHRDNAEKWALKKGPDGLRKYVEEKNQLSIDGLPAFKRGS